MVSTNMPNRSERREGPGQPIPPAASSSTPTTTAPAPEAQQRLGVPDTRLNDRDEDRRGPEGRPDREDRRRAGSLGPPRQRAHGGSECLDHSDGDRVRSARRGRHHDETRHRGQERRYPERGPTRVRSPSHCHGPFIVSRARDPKGEARQGALKPARRPLIRADVRLVPVSGSGGARTFGELASQTFFGNDSTMTIAVRSSVIAVPSSKARARKVSILELMPAKNSTVANMIVIRT